MLISWVDVLWYCQVIYFNFYKKTKNITKQNNLLSLHNMDDDFQVN